jgi:hypothetical protein
MEGLEILERGGNVLVLVPTKRHGVTEDGTVEAFGAVDDAAQLIEGSDSDLIEVMVAEGRSSPSILERFVLRAITLQAEARGKAVWVR